MYIQFSGGGCGTHIIIFLGYNYGNRLKTKLICILCCWSLNNKIGLGCISEM